MPRSLRSLAVPALCALCAVIAGRSAPGATAAAITNIDQFLEQCPSSDPIYANVLADFELRRNGVVSAVPACTPPISALPVAQYTDELIALQGLRVAYYLDRHQPGSLPWTPLTFYDWLRTHVDGIDFRDDIGGIGGICCEVLDGKTFFVARQADEDNRNFDRKWEGIAGNLGFYAHEVRHADPVLPSHLHTSCCGITNGCDQEYDETDISSYGVQWFLEQSWLTGALDVGIACLPEPRRQEIASWHRTSANSIFRERFCTNFPPDLTLPASPGGRCGPKGAEVIVPVVAHANGASGSVFRSDLKLYNPNAVPLDVSLFLTHRGEASSSRDGRLAFTLAPREVRFLEDVYATIFPDEEGAARVQALTGTASGDVLPVVVDGSTYAVTQGGGELGLTPTTFARDAYLKAGARAAIVVGKAAERTNGFVLIGPHPTAIEWTYRPASGVETKVTVAYDVYDTTVQYTGGWSQLFGVAIEPNAVIEARILRGSARIAETPVHNVSNQGRWVDATRIAP